MTKNTELLLTWQLCRGEDRNRCVSKKLNPEWTVKCGWSQTKPYKPDFIEICRNSSSTECLLWGMLSLHVTGSNELLMKRKFVSLLETNCQFTRLQLQYAIGSTRPPQAFYLTGRVIPSDFADFANAEGSGNELLQLSNDLNVLLNPEVPSYADVNLRCGAVIIPAHRSILSARSPIFAAMFAKGMEGSQDAHVDIADMDASVLRSMLTFMYTGKTNDIKVSQASDLLHAADMYELQGLKTACSTYLKSNISIDNILSVLVLGDLYDPDLKHFAMDFICDKSCEFSVLRDTPEWKELLSEMSSLAIEVLTSVVESQEEKLQTSNA